MQALSYRGYRFPAAVIHHAVWLYLRFTLSLRDVEELLAERGIIVSYETIRRWVTHFGPMYARRLDGGISTKCLSRLLARRCICGVLSMMKVRFSTSWSKPDAISMQRCD